MKRQRAVPMLRCRCWRRWPIRSGGRCWSGLAAQPSCVCHLQEHVPIAASLLSYHLKVLREAGLVTASRRGRWIDYALADGALDRLRAALPGVVTGKEPSS